MIFRKKHRKSHKASLGKGRPGAISNIGYKPVRTKGRSRSL